MRGLFVVGAAVLIAVALLACRSTGPAQQSQRASATNTLPAVATTVALVTKQEMAQDLTRCGAGLPGQSPTLGSFAAASSSEVYQRLPNLQLIGEIETFTPPFVLVLFDRGVFRWPVPVFGGPGIESYKAAPHTVLCIVHDGRPDFYTDGDFSGFVAQP